MFLTATTTTALLVLCLSSALATDNSTTPPGPMDPTTETPICPRECSCKHENFGIEGEDRYVVDCRDVGLGSVPDLSSLKGTSVYRIYLDLNDIQSVPDKAFDGLNIEGIDLSNNVDLEFISNSSFYGLDISLKYLSLKGTRVDQTKASRFLPHLRHLQVLDLSDNKATFDSFETIYNDTFTNLANLEELDLSGNSITEIDEFTFKHMTVLTILKLNENSLAKIPRAIRGANNLQELTLVSNSIKEIPKDSFDGLVRLKTLILSDNGLEDATVHAEAFKDCGHSLIELNLEFNKLTTVPSHIFPHLKKIMVLKLNGNKIQEISGKAFTGLEDLIELDISENTLELNADSFEGLTSVQHLHLKAMGLSEMPTDALRPLKELTDLDLSSNRIETLTKASFDGLDLKSFNKLTITYNGLEEIEPDTFDGFNSLGRPLHLILSHNLITNVSFLEDACRFSKVELRENPVDCTCALFGYTYGLYQGFFTLDGECATPGEYAGVKLQEFPGKSKEMCESRNVTYVDDDNDCSWIRPETNAASNIQSWMTLSVLFCLFYGLFQ